MKKWIAYILCTILVCVGLGALTMTAAQAHNIALTGTTTCLQDGSWQVKVRVDVTNTPSNMESETKAINPGSGLTTAGGSGVMAGNQVMLNAWYEHRNNWPGVQTRKGNYSDYYTINVPASQSYVDTMVQIDWKGWRSEDPTKRFWKPQDCKPAPPEPQAESKSKRTEPNCAGRYGSWEFFERHRDPVWNAETQVYDWGPWSDWTLVNSWQWTIDPEKCELPAWVRVKVTDKCSCRNDSVTVHWNHNKVRVHKERVNKMTWKITATGKKKENGKYFVLPERVNGNHGWERTQVYKVKTTAKACPCRKRGDCRDLYPNWQHIPTCVGRGGNC